jgi:hypothetical protein
VTSRPRQTIADFNAAAHRREPPGFSRQSKRLDEIAAADERHRQEQAQIALMEAELIAYAKQGEMKADDAAS